jgi:hypothetical protein
MLSGSRRNRNGYSRHREPAAISYKEPVASKLRDSMSPVKAALITFGATKLKDMLGEMLPGFGEHLRSHQNRYRGFQG